LREREKREREWHERKGRKRKSGVRDRGGRERGQNFKKKLGLLIPSPFPLTHGSSSIPPFPFFKKKEQGYQASNLQPLGTFVYT